MGSLKSYCKVVDQSNSYSPVVEQSTKMQLAVQEIFIALQF